jgi:hypothetical protein
MTYGGTETNVLPPLRHPPVVLQLPPQDPAGMEHRASPGLEVCLECGEDFVSMSQCTWAGSGTWWLLLRCGACQTWHETFARDETVVALQEAITRGFQAVQEQVRCLELERMQCEVEAFSQALELDLIGPDDFPA